jgi:hypothetical protein
MQLIEMWCTATEKSDFALNFGAIWAFSDARGELACKLAVQQLAQVAELVDALVSGTSGATRGGSSPLLGTTAQHQIIDTDPKILSFQELRIFFGRNLDSFAHSTAQ